MPAREPTGTDLRARAPLAFGKYELVQRLGSGGMAEVWRARIKGPAGFSRSLVIKRILPHLAQDAAFVNMFIAEARISAKLNHPNVIQVFELGQVEDEYYIAMEYVRGRDLSSLMRTHLDRGERMPPAVCAYIIREVCRALACAHDFHDEDGNATRIIHRDVSPSNVMLSYDGAVKLLDFGIAKAFAESSDHTQTGTLKGKFAYMSPEQLEGAEIDHRADIFAAGVILHEIVTGKRLFRGANDLQTISLVKAARVDPPSQIHPDIPKALDRIVLRALVRDLEARYQSVAEMADELDDVVHELKGGPHVVARLLADSSDGEGPTPSGARLTALPKPAVAPLLAETVPFLPKIAEAATASPLLVPAAAPTQANDDDFDPLPAAATIVEPSGSFFIPDLAPPAAPSEPSASPQPTSSDLIGGLLRMQPRRRRLMFGGSAVIIGVVGAALLWPLLRPRLWPRAPRPVPEVVEPRPAVQATPPPLSLPVPAPPPKTTVLVRVLSEPVGAEVFLDDEAESRGKTPMVLTLPIGADEREIKLVARGYQPLQRTFSTVSDTQLDYSLVRVAPKPRPRPQPPKKPVTTSPSPSGVKPSNELADPFGDKHKH